MNEQMIQHFILLSIQVGEHWWWQCLDNCKNPWSGAAMTWLPLEKGAGDLLALGSISSSLLQQRFPRGSREIEDWSLHNFSLEMFISSNKLHSLWPYLTIYPKPTKPFLQSIWSRFLGFQGQELFFLHINNDIFSLPDVDRVVDRLRCILSCLSLLICE